MSQQGERRLWRYIYPHLKKWGHVERIESHATGWGIPDVNYCIKGVEGWIELKYTDSEKRGLKLRPAQAVWASKRLKQGGLLFLLARIDIPPARAYLIIEGSKVLRLRTTTRVTDWVDECRQMWVESIDWEELRWILTNDPAPSETTQASQK